MFPLNKYESFIEWFNSDYAYRHAAKRIKNLIAQMNIPEEIIVEARKDCFSLPNYMDCSRNGIWITVKYNLASFKYIDYFYAGMILENNKIVYPYNNIWLEHESYVYIHNCVNMPEFYQELNKVINKVSSEIDKMYKRIEIYKPLIDKGYIFNNIIYSDSATNAQVNLSVNTLDDFIAKCVESNINVDVDYRNYVIDTFKKEAKGEKVDYDFSAWVATPQAYSHNKAEILKEEDIINTENARFAEILSRINGDVVPCKTYQDIVEREG